LAAEKPAPDADKKASRDLREQDIYIPYEKLRQVFEKHGRGVFLPYEKFEELWKAARDNTQPPGEVKAPVDALITEIENEATVSKDVVTVSARLKIDVLTEGWHEVPLCLGDAAITRAVLHDQPARILGGGGADYRLLIEKKGKQPEQIELLLEFAKAISRAPGQNSVSFQVPRAPVSRWRVRIPQSGVKVTLYPLLAATEVPPEKSAVPAKAEAKPENKPDATPEKKPEKPSPAAAADDKAKEPPKTEETVILAFVGATPNVRIEWTPKAEGATGLAALASVQTEQQVSINEGVIRTHAHLTYTISRAELGQLVIEVPADQKVVNLFDANVRQWSVKPPAAGSTVQEITAQLFEPAKQSQQLTIELEKLLGEKQRETLRPPLIKALDVGRQQGVVVVQVAAGLRAEATRANGLLQIDAGELPAALAGTPWTFSYRYAAVPYELELAVEPLEPRITVESLVTARLEPERLTVDLTAIYNIQRSGVFKLEWDVPAGYDVRQVRGAAIDGASEVQVESHRLEGAKKTRLVVNLARRAIGRVALAIRLEKELPEANLLSPTVKAADIVLPLPQVAPGGAEQSTGRLAIYAPESLQVNPGVTKGLRSISFKEVLEGTQQRPAQAPPQGRMVLAFAYTQEPATLHLAAQRRKPQVTIRQLLVARIEEGVIKYQDTFYYNVQYSGVKSLRIDVPADLAAALRNNTPAVRDKLIDPPPPKLANDYVAWSFSGEAELFGEGRIELVWEKKIEKLDVGRHTELSVPRLVPRDVDRAWGQIVLAKAETLDVQEAAEPTGLRPIDPQHDLMAEVTGAARAFEFHDDWKLPVAITRHELEEVKRTSIDRAVVRMVVTPAHEITVQALYRMRSARQRLTLVLPEHLPFDSDPLRINGQPKALEHGKPGEYFIPLTSSSPDEPFLLELRYTVRGDGRQLDLPSFPGDGADQQQTAVQKIFLYVYRPQNETLLGTRGPWSEEYSWELAPSLAWEPLPRLDDLGRVAWVQEQVKLSGGADAFPTDGTLWAFSSLRPDDPPAGSLRMVAVDRRGLAAAVFVLIVLGGVLLLPAGRGPRSLAVGGLIVALVLCGVFLPTFSLQVLNGTLAAAILVVLVLWTVSCFVHRRAAAPPAPQPADVQGGPSHA
jgi:hypothetical protein